MSPPPWVHRRVQLRAGSCSQVQARRWPARIILLPNLSCSSPRSFMESARRAPIASPSREIRLNWRKLCRIRFAAPFPARGNGSRRCSPKSRCRSTSDDFRRVGSVDLSARNHLVRDRSFPEPIPGEKPALGEARCRRMPSHPRFPPGVPGHGWEKLYSERVAMAHERRFGMQVRIARFQNRRCADPYRMSCRTPRSSFE